MDRAEHLQWAKNRAMEYANAGDYPNAVASMLSDLGKHEETKGALQWAGALMLMCTDRKSTIDFIQGFN